MLLESRSIHVVHQIISVVVTRVIAIQTMTAVVTWSVAQEIVYLLLHQMQIVVQVIHEIFTIDPEILRINSEFIFYP